MPDTTAHHTRQWSLRALYLLAPATAVALLVYLSGWLPDQHGRVLFQSLLMATCTAVIVAAVASGQLAIANAFRAGYMTGRELGRAEQAARDAKHLRLVTDDDGVQRGNGTE